MHNSDFWSRITSLYVSQTSPVVLYMQYSVISIGIPCLYGSQPLSVVFGCTTATFGAELQVSMGPRHDLSFCGCKTAWLASEVLVSIGPSPLDLWMQNSVLVPEWQLYMGSSPSPVVLCMQTSDFRTTPTGLYGSQTSPLDLWPHNRVLSTRISSLYGF